MPDADAWIARGQVTGSRDGRLQIECAAQAGCARCEAGTGCGQALWGRRVRPVSLELDETTHPHGQQVALYLPAARVLAAAGLAYGLPLLGLMLGALVAAAASPASGDAPAALGALLGLAGGWLSARRLASRRRSWLAPSMHVDP